MFWVCLVFAFFGVILGYAAIRFKIEGDPLVAEIEAVLPQTQCGQCSFPGFKPYAEAIARGKADINQCPPGGEAGVKALADLLGLEVKPLDENFGVATEQKVAVIVETDCIGCTMCIQACPVDAILGAAKYMHTVIAFECTGCDLCVDPCPVDCIVMTPIGLSVSNWQWPEPVNNRH